MTERHLRRWVRAVRNGRLPADALIDKLRRLPFDETGVARLDTHRPLRRGLPEVVLCDGKSPQQIVAIARRLLSARDLVLLTRLDPLTFTTIRRQLPTLRYDPAARLAYHPPRTRRTARGLALVVTGGTADVPVAEEAARTLELLGSRAVRLYDVGVAGVHRLLSQWPLLRRARVIVVIAGMEGALASVVAGLVAAPVIAVVAALALVAVGLKAKFMVPDGCFEDAFIKAAGEENLNDRCYVTFGGLPPEKLTGKGKDFVDNYVKKYGNMPEGYAVYGYEAAKVALEGVRRAGKKDREAIRSACFTIRNFEGALGSWSFDRNGDTTLKTMSGQIVRNGKFEFFTLLGEE